MEYLKVKNWEEFQHYKYRTPPWIKLHRALLDDYEFARLQDASKAHLMLIWLFASQKSGIIPNDPGFLKKKLGLEKEPNLNLFIDHGLLLPEQDASNAIADSKQSAPLVEKSREEKSRAEVLAPSGAFLRFWTSWPKHQRKQSQGKCWSLWRQKDFDQIAQVILTHVDALKASDDWLRGFVPAPLVYLNQQRWEGADQEAPELKVAMP